ncbi:G-type lectin S-receptor-like serine/threonine-protein kinase At5g35370 [Argentina anserina]|uniref:G-type lectin S-receptor-like serine/threonine-protein kinase At5g35370 n=1 Tax=Argentina anserina TaxID=57926 RepID=UPI002176288E|nr:G-type lectin S-receptor-like serine/threonine-protein kinase At5g35370 [Potentilla anserina]
MTVGDEGLLGYIKALSTVSVIPVRFSYEELVTATENFSNQIGSGGFDTVYKGILADKTLVVVKKMTCLGVRGKMEFCNETTSIGSIHHVNLVKLRGFCIHGKQCFLVYDYMNRGSLENILFGNGSNEPILIQGRASIYSFNSFFLFAPIMVYELVLYHLQDEKMEFGTGCLEVVWNINFSLLVMVADNDMVLLGEHDV